ncbi:MAG: ArsC family transcriptional regulator [Chitinophagaceae bacterium]|nr:ArsC family transcriptional regulator [Chitinophagaceae bacterium]
MFIIYGIPNCDTIKKVRTWFESNRIPYQFHDYKKEGIGKAKLQTWLKQKDWSVLVNTKSTTWKNLGEKERALVNNAKSALPLMEQQTSVIKRPVIEKDDKIIAVGFNEQEYKNLFIKKP